MNMPNKQSRLYDGIFWIIILILAGCAAFAMLTRDAHHRFGGVSYGVFPSFHFKDTDGMLMDDHQMKARVSVVHAVVDRQYGESIANQLDNLVKISASGKRHLYVLTFVTDPQANVASVKGSHMVVKLEPSALKGLLDPLGRIDDFQVYLVDQNGVIRSTYDLKSIDEYKRLSTDVLRLL